jgi:hypothetical protein
MESRTLRGDSKAVNQVNRARSLFEFSGTADARDLGILLCVLGHVDGNLGLQDNVEAHLMTALRHFSTAWDPARYMAAPRIIMAIRNKLGTRPEELFMAAAGEHWLSRELGERLASLCDQDYSATVIGPVIRLGPNAWESSAWSARTSSRSS